MTPPCPAPAGDVWEAHVFALVGPDGLRFVAARDGATWTLYDAQGTIIRDGVRPDRLPAVLLALVSPAPKE